MDRKFTQRPIRHEYWPNFKLNMDTMAQIAVLALSMSLAACGGNDVPEDVNLDPDKKKEVPEVQKMKVDFHEIDAPKQPADFRNVHVEENMWYTFTVTGTGKASEYEYRFNQNDVLRSQNHDESGFNYLIHLFTEAEYIQYKKTKLPKLFDNARVKRGGCNIKPDTKYFLQIRPTVAGTFNLKFSFSRTKANSKETGVIKVPFTFYSTKLNAYYKTFHDVKTDIYHREYFFEVDCGNKVCDTLLKPAEGKTITWEVNYFGKHFSGNYKHGKAIRFYVDKPQKGFHNVENYYIDSVKLHIIEQGKASKDIAFGKKYMIEDIVW